MRGAAASAIAAGRDAQAGFDAVSDAAATQLSARLNGIGVAQNLSTYYKRLSDDLQKNVDDLTEAERAQALYNLILEATSTEVEALGTIQNEYVRSQQAAKLASDNLSRTLGESAMPIVTRYKMAQANLTNTIIESVKAYQQGGDALEVLGKKYPQLAQALTRLKPIADEMKRGLLDAWAGIRDFAERVLFPVFESLRPMAERAWKYIPPLIASAGHAIGETFRLIAQVWDTVLKPVWEAIGPIIEAALSRSFVVLTDALDFISGIFTSIRALIHGDWRGAWDTFSETVGTAWEKVNTVLQGLGQSIRAALDRLVTLAIEKGRNFGLNLRDSIVAGVSGLAEQLTDKMTEAINRMTEKLPQWFKDRFGITAVVETLEGNADAAGARAAGARAGIAGRAPTIDPSTLNDFEASVYSAALDQRADQKADSLVDYCARWVRDTLGDAAPEMRKAINALFLNNGGPNGSTARTAYANFQKAGLARDYKTFADLKPGDTVFYVDGGQNHTGVYIGNGMVRGNNRVTYQENGGRFGPGGITSGVALDSGKVNPVGDVQINRLGKVTGYVAAQELLAYLTGRVPVTGTPKAGTTANVPTVKPPAPPADTTDQGGPFTAAQYAQAQKLLATIEQAKKALQAKPGDAGLALALSNAEKESEKFSKSSGAAADALKAAQAAAGGAKSAVGSYAATLADLKKYGDTALRLIKDVEIAQKSGSAAQISAANAALTRFQEQGKAQAAVLDAERAAYQSRQQLREQSTQDEQARAQLSAQIARDAAAGREAEARRGLEQLKRSQADRLDLAEGDAAKTAQIITSTGPQILAAEAAIARRVREQAVRAAQDTATERLKVEGANKGEIEKARRAAVAEAYRVEKEAGVVARAEQQRAERGANRTAAEEQKRLAAELAGLKVDAAKATAGRLKAIDDADLARYEGDAQARVALVRKYSQAEFDRQQSIAIATRKLAYDDAKGKPNEVALRAKAQAEYLATIETARIARLGQVKTAQDAVTRSLEDGVKAGNAALDGLEKLNLGGRDLAAAVKPLGSTDGLFAELTGRIVELAGELDTPGVAEAWIAQIEAMGKAGQLTALQVIRLKEEVNALAGIEASLNEFGLRVSDTTGAAPRYQTDDELAGKGVPATDPAPMYFNLAEAIENVGEFSRDELGELIRLTDLSTDSALKLWEAWNQKNPVDLGKQLDGIMQAQALLDALEAATDPVQIQAITVEVANFLASDVGKILPDGVKQGLTDGVEGAKEYAGILAGLTADAVADGLQDAVTRTSGAKLPENRFKEFADQIMGGAFDLSNPEVLKGLNEGLDISVKNGELTVRQLESLKLIIDSINAAPLSITGRDQDTAPLEGAIEAITSKIDEAEGQYRSGALSAEQYSAALRTQQEALLALLVNLEKLGPEYAAAAASVRLLLNTTADSIPVLEQAGDALVTLGDEKAADLALQGVKLVKSFQEGATSAKDFAQQGLDLAGSMNTMADAAERAGRADLAAEYRTWAAELDALVPAEERSAYYAALLAEAVAEVDQAMGGSKPGHAAMIARLNQLKTAYPGLTSQIDQLVNKLGELDAKSAKEQAIEKMTAKINKFADYARKSIPLVTSAFQALGGASEEVAAGWGDSLSRMVDDVVNFATAIAKGDYMGAAIQALTSIFTFFTRKAEEARAELKKTMDYSKQFRFDNGNGYDTRKTTSTTTGFLFWQKTIVTEEIDEMGKALALSFEGAVVNGVGSGLAEAVAQNDSSILEKSILTGMKNAALQGLTEAFLQSPKLAAILGPLIQKLIAAFKSGNTENIRAAVAEFREGVRSMRGEMDGLVEAGRIVTEELGGAGESFASSFGDSIRAGVRALLSGQSPLQVLYDDVRTRIGDAVVNGFYVQAALDKLQPFLDAVKAKLDAGLDPTQAIAQIGMQLPGISAQLQLELGPLVAALNTYLPNALNANTAALNGNTAALNASKFESTTIYGYADVGRNDTRVRQQLAGL